MGLIHKGTKIASNAVTGDTLPIGSMIPYGSLTIPEGWLRCDGSAVSRTTHSQLFSVIGTSYGVGNGSTTFNLPNKKGRGSVGYDSAQTEFDTIGKTGGAKTHTLTKQQLPQIDINTNFAASPGGDGSGVVYGTTVGNNNNILVSNVNFGGQAHNNLQPYETDVWIIKAKQSAGVVAKVIDNLISTSSTDALSAGKGKDLNDRLYLKGQHRSLKLNASPTVNTVGYVQLPFLTDDGGDNTLLEKQADGRIKIMSSSISKVLVFAMPGSVSNAVFMGITKNGSNYLTQLFLTGAMAQLQVVMPVVQGDIIGVAGFAQNAGTTVDANGGPWSIFTVMVI